MQYDIHHNAPLHDVTLYHITSYHMISYGKRNVTPHYMTYHDMIQLGWGKERDKGPREGLRSMVDGVPDEEKGQGHQMDLEPPSEDAKTIFVGGLNPTITR